MTLSQATLSQPIDFNQIVTFCVTGFTNVKRVIADVQGTPVKLIGFVHEKNIIIGRL